MQPAFPATSQAPLLAKADKSLPREEGDSAACIDVPAWPSALSSAANEFSIPQPPNCRSGPPSVVLWCPPSGAACEPAAVHFCRLAGLQDTPATPESDTTARPLSDSTRARSEATPATFSSNRVQPAQLLAPLPRGAPFLLISPPSHPLRAPRPPPQRLPNQAINKHHSHMDHPSQDSRWGPVHPVLIFFFRSFFFARGRFPGSVGRSRLLLRFPVCFLHPGCSGCGWKVGWRR